MTSVISVVTSVIGVVTSVIGIVTSISVVTSVSLTRLTPVTMLVLCLSWMVRTNVDQIGCSALAVLP